MAKHIVKCPFCGQSFDANNEEFVKIGRRYAHASCYKQAEENKSQEEKDKEQLEQYILHLFNETKINAKIRKQIKQYREEENYTYTGMYKALVYFYEVKKNPIDKANGGIGIIPYIYDIAYQYYYSIWLANQKNEHKLVEQYVPQIEEVKIPIPKRKERKRKLFMFLDEEE